MNHQPVPTGLPEHRFPVEPWRLVEREYAHDDLGVTETIFALGNGYLGMRANPEEGREAHSHGTFVNGFHEIWSIQHAEDAFGFAKTGQTIVNVPDAKLMKLYVDDEPLLLAGADLDEYERVLDFRSGVLTRDLVWRTPAGKRVRVRSRRMVSFTHRHLAVMTFEITLLDSAAPVVVSSQLLNRQDGEDEYHVRSAALGEGMDPRQGPQVHAAGAAPDPAARARERDRAGLPLRELGHDARLRNPSPDRDVVPGRGEHRCQRRPGQDRVQHPRHGRRADSDHEARRRTIRRPVCPARNSPTAARARSSGPRPTGSISCSGNRRSGSTRSGRRPTSNFAATTATSRPCGGTSSSSPRRRPAPRSRASPPRA